MSQEIKMLIICTAAAFLYNIWAIVVHELWPIWPLYMPYPNGLPPTSFTNEPAILGDGRCLVSTFLYYTRTEINGQLHMTTFDKRQEKSLPRWLVENKLPPANA